MPRRDPITGCEVMTTGEFLAAEAEREGKQPHEIWDEIWQALDEDNRRMEGLLRDGEYIYSLLMEELVPEWEDFVARGYTWEEGDPHVVNPNRILKVEVREASHQQNFRGSGGSVEGILFFTDGTARRFSFWWSHSSGSFYEPPDADSEFVLL